MQSDPQKMPSYRAGSGLLAAAAFRPALFCALFFTASGPAQSAVLPGAQPKKWPANAEKHVIVVRRDATDETEAKLIAAAEAAYPPKGEVRGAAETQPAPDGDKLWWYKEDLGIRIPYAVTAEAVAYYGRLVEGYGKQAFERYAEPSSRFEYRASVRAHETFAVGDKTFRQVRVVTLKLTFEENFSATQTEGMQFTKERLVIFDAEGRVVHIAGDGPCEVAILAI